MRPRTKWKLSKMAGHRSWPKWLIGLFLTNFCLLATTVRSSELKSSKTKSSNVQFNNPGLLDNLSIDDDAEEKFLSNVDRSQEAVDPKKWGGLDIQREARALAFILSRLSNAEMGVTKMQEIYDSMPYTRKELSEEEQVDELASKLGAKIHSFQQVLRSNRVLVQSLYKFHVKKPITRPLRCCDLNTTLLSYEELYDTNVSRTLMCDLVPSSVTMPVFNPGRNLSDAFRHNKYMYTTLKWQYFISSHGVHTEYPAHMFTDCNQAQDVRHRDVFVSTVQPQRKNIVILVDHGNSLSTNQLRIAKAVAIHILDSLNENDRIGVIGLSSQVSYPHVEDCPKASYPRADDCLSVPLMSSKNQRADECLSMHMTALTVEAKNFLKKFIENLEKQDGPTAHALGFEKSFDMLRNSTENDTINTDQEDFMIAYISRGLLSSLTEAKDVFQKIATGNAAMSNQVIINTYAVIDVGKPIMYELLFLRNIAAQNFANYAVTSPSSSPLKKGVMVSVNSTHDLTSSVGGFYKVFNRTSKAKTRFSLPHSDLVGNGLVVSLILPCYHDDGMFIGVVGVDVHLSEVVQDVTYFSQEVSAYSFVIDSQGYTIMHPSLTRPLTTRVQPMHTDIRHFESSQGFLRIRDRMLSERSGQATLILKVPRNDTKEVEKIFHATYTWKRVNNSPYIVVIKLLDRNSVFRELDAVDVATMPELVYHRLDLIPPKSLCLHLQQLATLDSSTVFLSANAFAQPFDHLSQSETKKMIKDYLAYLQDNMGYIINPTFKDNIKNDVAALFRINSQWLRTYHHSELNDYLVRRYVATPSGVFSMYPGALLSKLYDPTKRTWYERALEYKDHVTLTAPYLDVAGAGYIVTLSNTIYEGREGLPHHNVDRVVGVMGLDLTVRYMYKLLSDQMSVCQDRGIRCFIVDDKGYLVAHPDLISPEGSGPAELQHITHKEPLVASDILNHEYFVTKRLCNSYNFRTMQRYYQFNTSLSGVLTNLKHGEHCARYLITPLPGTNAFVGIVNQTCTMRRAFCPCSTVDRLCLNCNRMEQSECECPCECPLKMNFCSGDLYDDDDRNPSCPRPPEENKLAVVGESITADLKQCYPYKCESRKTKEDCFGIIDCEWCELENGTTLLPTPYCATQRHCFGGVLGAASPYHDEIPVIKPEPVEEEEDDVKGAPVGPVAGGIMGCFLMLALGVYCYRHHVHRRNHHYVTASNESNGPLRRLDNDMEELDVVEEPGHTNAIVLATFENVATISPYRMNTTYRRPTGGDSDHGYSTMTPHEDSEQASTSCMEPIIVGKDRYRPTSHISQKPFALPPPPNHHRRSRSPTPPHATKLSPHTIPEHTSLLTPQTTIPESNHVLASVQVHMVDTH